jgi:hypothetical protein
MKNPVTSVQIGKQCSESSTEYSTMETPGMTRYPSDQSIVVKPFLTSQNWPRSLQEKKVILLATAAITQDNLFTNGLFQNVYVLYRMFESMQYIPMLVVNKKAEETQVIPWYMKNLRSVVLEDLVKHPIPICMYLEIGMSIEPNVRRFFKTCGAKVSKLYLGNILNIDIETPMFYPSVHFSHHVIGELDEIWVSPHYYQHAEYARAMNHVDVEKETPMVAPYVWDPEILLDGGKRFFQWKAPETVEDDVFLLLEPNISFQKCSLVPLLAIEAWYRKNPEWKGRVEVVNGERLLLIPFFKETIWPSLDLVKHKKLTMGPRCDILTLLQKFPSAIPICHQWNNEYNYMVLEYFWTGYPVLHNASDWKDYGYCYEGSSILSAVKQIEHVRANHAASLETYKAHARALAWRHSPYNPDVQNQWNALCG